MRRIPIFITLFIFVISLMAITTGIAFAQTDTPDTSLEDTPAPPTSPPDAGKTESPESQSTPTPESQLGGCSFESCEEPSNARNTNSMKYCSKTLGRN